MRYHISYVLLSFTVPILLGACKKNFLETYPTTALANDQVLATTVNAYAALNGIHRLMYYPTVSAGTGEATNNLYRDLLGEDIVYPLANGSTAPFGWLQWINHRNANATDLRTVYRFYYQIISNANVLINGVDGATGPEADKRVIKGQALAYRAWAHFQLVQLWGKRYDATAKPNLQPGVPLLLANELEGQPRATVEYVYTQINKDLDSSIILLAGYNRSGSAAKSNLNVNVAKGIKARVALTQQDWETAATYAVAARSGYPLMDTVAYKSGFNNINNAEWIWGSRVIDEQSTYSSSYFAYMSANFNSTAIRTQPKAINALLWEAIATTDVRKRIWDRTGSSVPIPPGGARVPYQNQKFLAQSSSSSVGDITYMRAAEMYLIEAEARARKGQNTAAQDALFTLIRSRNPNYIQPTTTGQALIDEIMFNRRIELWGEGFRFTDLKRLNLPMDRTGITNNIPAIIQVIKVAAGDKQWEWLFPQDELNTNPNVLQNPL
jgi:starch-binding outer membrane protein, SusD/RagB family